MKLSERIKTYNFWVSLSSAIFLIIKVLGTQIGFNVDESLFSDLITSICSILVLLGIIVPPKNPEIKLKTNTENTSTETIEVDSNQLKANDLETINETNIDELNNIVKVEEVCEHNIENIADNNNSSFENISTENNEIIDIDIKSADFNIENIDNENFNSIQTLKENLKEELSSKEKLFENNIEEYIRILEIKVNELKCK